MDHILYWNEVALEANRVDFTFVPEGKTKPASEQGGPTLSSRALAIVHLAMYDAHAGSVNSPANLPRYLTPPASPTGANAAAAVAAAAHTTLCALYPRQRPFFDAKLQSAGLNGAGIEAGHDFGLAVARAHLAARAADPDVSDRLYSPSMGKGHHRLDPVSPTQGFHAPSYGALSKCFAVMTRHELMAPPGRATPEYVTALRQVRGKGIAPELMGTLPNTIVKRSVDETLIGLFWGFDGARDLGTPPRLYNQIVRRIAIDRTNTADQNARLFALVNAAMGDAGILAWEQKYKYDLWRPVIGLREHDASMGPVAPQPTANINDDCDPLWLPLGAPATNSTEPNFTPPFPAYPSGHATFGAAALHMTRLFYKGNSFVGNRANDDLFPSSFVSEELNGVNKDNRGIVRPRHERSFPGGLWQMIIENGLSRVYLGVHWSYDAFALAANGQPDLSRNVGGVPLGLAIAEDMFQFGGGKAPKRSTV